MHRRIFITAGSKAVAGAVLAASGGLEACLKILGSPASTPEQKHSAIVGLLEQRHQLYYGQETPSLNSTLGNLYAQKGQLVRSYIDPVGSPEFLSQQEALELKDKLSALKASYTEKINPLFREADIIDNALVQHKEELKEVLAPRLEHNQKIDKLAGSSASEDEFLKKFLAERPLEKIDFTMIDDAKDITLGQRPCFSDVHRHDTRNFGGRLDRLIRETDQSININRDEAWEEKRRTARMEYVRKTLLALVENHNVNIESTLNKHYGNDDWVITTRYNKPAIDAEIPERITPTLEALKHHIPLAHPERFKESQSENIKLVSPKQSPKQAECGEHDYERLTIRNPEFALREALKEAEEMSLKLHNQSSRSKGKGA